MMSADRQRIESFVRRNVRCGFWKADQPPIPQLVDDVDNKLFEQVQHVLLNL